MNDHHVFLTRDQLSLLADDFVDEVSIECVDLTCNVRVGVRLV